jgi:DNA-binding NtrC family response regulator
MVSAMTSSSLSDHSILIVEPSLDDLLQSVLMMSRMGLHVTAAATFAQAKQLLNTSPPSVLFTALRLGIYNGLHLVLHGKSSRPSLAALVAAPVADPVLQADAEAMGATFLVKPFSERELIGALMQTLFRRDAESQPIRPPYERRQSQRRESELPVSPDRRASDRRRVPWPAPERVPGINHE